MRCENCGLVYTPELPGGGDFLRDASAQLGSLDREKVEYWSFPELYSKHERVFRGFFDERLRRIQKHARSLGESLDIGCGYGLWMSYLSDRGIPCSGFDISEEAVRHCRDSFGLDAVVDRVETFSSAKKFASIVMCDVLEHVEDPRSVLRRCRAMLAPGGVLYVQVPNVLGFKIPYGHGLGLPHHIWQFSPGPLRRLLEACDLEPIEYWTGILGVIGVYEKGGPGLLERAKWQVARTLKIGNRLQMIAKPRGDARG